MDEPLHPSTLSEILDRTAQIYRSRFLVFLGIAVIPTAALLLFVGIAAVLILRLGPNAGNVPDAVVGFLALGFTAGLLLVVLPAMIATTALATAAMSHAASRACFGQGVTIRGSYKAVWRRAWRYIGLFVFETVAIWVLPIGAWSVLVVLSAGLAALAASAGMSGGGLLVLAGFLVVAGLVTYGFWMALRLSLAFPACVVEQIGVWDGLKRSSTLTQGTKGRILLLYLLGAALNWILSIAIWFPLIVVLALLPGANSPQHAQTAGMVLLLVVYGAGFAVQAFTRPVYGIALMNFYYDQRIRQEGFDIEWMMMQAGLVVPAADQTEARAEEAPLAASGDGAGTDIDSTAGPVIPTNDPAGEPFAE